MKELEQLLIRNYSKCKMNERIRLETLHRSVEFYIRLLRQC